MDVTRLLHLAHAMGRLATKVGSQVEAKKLVGGAVRLYIETSRKRGRSGGQIHQSQRTIRSIARNPHGVRDQHE